MTDEKKQEILSTYADLRDQGISMERLFAMVTDMCEVEYTDVVAIITKDIKERADRGEDGYSYSLGG